MKRKSQFLLILISVIILLLAVSCVRNTSSVIEICSVPAITGLTIEEAEASFLEAGLAFEVEYIHHETIPHGQVISSEPEEGTVLEDCHEVIHLVVSDGPAETETTSETNGAWSGWQTGEIIAVDGVSQLELEVDQSIYRWSMKSDVSAYHYELAPLEPEKEHFNIFADTKRASGQTGSASGIVFNFKDTYNYWLFSVLDNGYYLLDQLVNGNWKSIVSAQETAIPVFGDFNRLQISAYENTYKFFINSTEVFEYTDPSGEMAGGQIGLAVRIAHPETVYEFSEFSADRTDIVVMTTPSARSVLFEETFGSENSLARFITRTLGDGEANYEIRDGQFYWELETSEDCKYRATIDNWINSVSNDISIQLTAQWLSGEVETCNYGIFFNYNPELGSYTYLDFNDQNFCSGYQYNSITREYEDILFDQNCFLLYSQPNKIQVDVSQNSFMVFVNDDLVFEHEDADMQYLEGSIGIQVECDQPGSSVFQFDNLKILEAAD